MKKIMFILLISLLDVNLGAQIITNYTTSDGLISNFVECVDTDINDNVWLGTSDGVQMYDGSNWILYNTSLNPGMASDNIKKISCLSDGLVWVGSDYGVSTFTPLTNNWLTLNSNNGLISNQVKSINEGADINGFLGPWIGTNQGVSFYNGFSFVSYSSPDLHWSGVSVTAFDSNGDQWFGSPLGGITHFDGTTFTHYDTANGLLSQNVTDIVIDNQDNKWIGTGGGVSVLDASNMTFTHHTRMYILSPPDTLNPVVDLEIDGYGRIWAAIYVGYLAQGGVAMWDGSSWIDYDVTDGIVGSNVKAVSIDSENNIWVPTSEGISKISAIPNEIHDAIIELDMFPNPCSDVFYLNNYKGDIKQLRVYNNLGVICYSNNIVQEQYLINVASLAKGIYYVNMQLSDRIITKKIVVN